MMLKSGMEMGRRGGGAGEGEKEENIAIRKTLTFREISPLNLQ